MTFNRASGAKSSSYFAQEVGMRKLALIVAIILLAGLKTMAQEAPKAEVALGYAYIRANSGHEEVKGFGLNGGSASASFNPLRNIGIIADFGGYHIANTGGPPVDANLYTYMFGPRLTKRGDPVEPFVQALFGGAHIGANGLGASPPQSAFAMTAGGGIDVKVNDFIAVRIIEADYLMTHFRVYTSTMPSPNATTQNNFRFSTGLVLRFGYRKH
jgi:hypothetical protein